MSDTKSVFYPSGIYSVDIINRAVEDYKRICSIAVTEQSGGITCRFSKSIADIDLTANEFSNYLIELANSRGEP